MSLHASAQNRAQASAISNQGTGPTPSPEQTNDLIPAEQGNTSAEKNLNKPLSNWDQVKLIQSAMKERHRQDYDQWGIDDLAHLLSPYKDGTTINSLVRFFRDLLLFVSKPKISGKFEENIPRGLHMIELLSDFFLELQDHTGYEEFAVYHSLHHFHDDQKVDFLGYAKEYLTGEELQAVLAANGKGEEPEPKKSIFQIVQQESDEHARAWAKRMDEGPHESKYFKTESELITALDHFYPGHSWPTSKAIIVANRLMVENLDRMEEDRLSIEQETLEQVKKRLANEAVRSALNLPAVGLHRITAIEDAMLSTKKLTVKKPGGAARAKKLASSPIKKPASARKPATKKKA